MNTKRKKITFGLIILVLFISIGYAVLTTVFNVNSSVSLSKVSFNVHFDNVVVSDDNKAEVTEGNDARITNEDKTEISFAVSLKTLGDFYQFTADIVNEGDIPGKVKSIDFNGITDSQKKLLKYIIYYSDSGKDIKPGDYIGPGITKNITVDLEYYLDENISNDDMPTDDMTLECTVVINIENGTLSEYRERAASNRLKQDATIASSSMVNFANPANSNDIEGLYILSETQNDDYPIYFYRGGNEKVNNHVILGGHCWRIMRTTSTGGIKLIYNGLPTDGNTCTGNPQYLQGMGSANTTNGSNPRYSGSDMARRLWTWYFENFIQYQGYLEDTVFCNAPYNTSGDIQLNCDEEYQISVANGKNNFPIAIPNAQELNLCGLAGGSSRFPWIVSGSDHNYITMSYNDGGEALFIDRFSSITRGYTSYGITVRPVVSLNSDVTLAEGDGTSTNPYIPSLD